MNKIIYVLDEKIHSTYSSKNYQWEKNIVDQTIFILKNKIRRKEIKMAKKYIDELHFFDLNIKSLKNINFEFFEINLIEFSSRNILKEINLFLDKEIPIPLNHSINYYENVINQLWDELVSSRQFNMIMNTKLKYNTLKHCDKELYICEIKNHKFQKTKLLEKLERNSKKRLFQMEYSPIPIEKKQKTSDIFEKKEFKKKYFVYF